MEGRFSKLPPEISSLVQLSETVLTISDVLEGLSKEVLDSYSNCKNDIDVIVEGLKEIQDLRNQQSVAFQESKVCIFVLYKKFLKLTLQNDNWSPNSIWSIFHFCSMRLHFGNLSAHINSISGATLFLTLCIFPTVIFDEHNIFLKC